MFRRLHPDQPNSFAFTLADRARAKAGVIRSQQLLPSLAALAATLCTVAPAFAADHTRLDLLISLICENGGSMETSQAAQILPAHGFTMEETQALVATLEQRGQVVQTPGIATLKLTPETCQ